MSEDCPLCYETFEADHICGRKNKSSDSGLSGFTNTRSRFPLVSIVAFAPLMGILLDLVLPLPSSLLHSVFVSVLGSTLVGLTWVMFKYEGSKSLNFYLKNLKNFAYTPNLLKLYSADGGRKATSLWLAAIIFSTALQVVFVTPGNAYYLAGRVSNQIDDASGANLDVECPQNKFYFYTDPIECRVKTGLLGISVPARVTLSPILGSADIKVSLL